MISNPVATHEHACPPSDHEAKNAELRAAACLAKDRFNSGIYDDDAFEGVEGIKEVTWTPEQRTRLSKAFSEKGFL